MMLTMCCLENLSGTKRVGEVQAKVEIDPMELLRFIMKGWWPVNEMCDRPGCRNARFTTGRKPSWNITMYSTMCRRHDG